MEDCREKNFREIQNLDGPFPQPVDGRLEQVAAALHVFIYAREAYRKRRIVELYGVPEPDAWVRINPDNHLIIRIFAFYKAY